MPLQPGKPQVLVVDDHPANRLAFEAVLAPDFTVDLAATGRQALGLALEGDYAVMLIDVKMPDMDGFEVAQLLRKRERTRHTPIVFISAYDQTVLQMKKGYVAGATDFVYSPVDEELLRYKVASYAELHQHNKALRDQIRELQKAVDLLGKELSRRTPPDLELMKRIKHLEAVIQGLKREMEAVSP